MSKVTKGYRESSNPSVSKPKPRKNVVRRQLEIADEPTTGACSLLEDSATEEWTAGQGSVEGIKGYYGHKEDPESRLWLSFNSSVLRFSNAGGREHLSGSKRQRFRCRCVSRWKRLTNKEMTVNLHD